MRIASVEVIPYELPYSQPYVTAAGRLEQREMVLLRLRSDEGLTGLGEAGPLSLRGGAALGQGGEGGGRRGPRVALFCGGAGRWGGGVGEGRGAGEAVRPSRAPPAGRPPRALATG